MELKYELNKIVTLAGVLLIEPYGIEYDVQFKLYPWGGTTALLLQKLLQKLRQKLQQKLLQKLRQKCCLTWACNYFKIIYL